MTHANVYLNFDGNTREAMNFYKDCLGGELSFQSVSELPEMAAQMPPHYSDHIMHSTLVKDGIVIMASDLCRRKLENGNAYSICIQCSSEEEIDRFFGNLSNGGKVVDPLMDAPWGAKYGSVTDKFGIQWIFNYTRN